MNWSDPNPAKYWQPGASYEAERRQRRSASRAQKPWSPPNITLIVLFVVAWAILGFLAFRATAIDTTPSHPPVTIHAQ